MDRDIALRLDGMLMGVRGCLDGVTYYMKGNVPPDEYEAFVLKIGTAMSEMVELSSVLHSSFPDIVPKGLKVGLV